MNEALKEKVLTIPELMEGAWQTAEDHGFHRRSRSHHEQNMLIVCEMAECSEDERRVEPWPSSGIEITPEGKPYGPAVELADAIIRIADKARSAGYHLHCALKAKLEYNKGRPYMHGKNS